MRDMVDDLRIKVTADTSDFQKGMKKARDEIDRTEKKSEESGKKTGFGKLRQALSEISPGFKSLSDGWDDSMDTMQKDGKKGFGLMKAAGLLSIAGLAGQGLQMITQMAQQAFSQIADLTKLGDPVRYEKSMARMQKATKTLKTSLSALASPIFEWLSKAVEKVAGVLNGLVETIMKVVGFVQGLFGLGGQLNSTLSATADGMTEATEAADAGLASFDKLNTLDTGEMGDAEQMARMDEILQDARESGAELAETLGGLFDLDLGGMWDGFTQWGGGVWDGFTEAAGGALDSVSSSLRTVWDKATMWGGNSVELVRQKGGAAWDWISSKGGAAWDWVTSKAGNSWDWVTSKAGGMWQGFTQWAGNAWEWVKTKAEGIWDAITGFVGDLWNRFLERMRQAWDDVKTKAEGIWDDITGFVGDLWEDFKEAMGEAWEAVTETAGQVWEDIKTKITQVWEDFIQAMRDAWDKVLEKAKGIWDDVKTKITQVWDDVKNYALSKFTNLKDDIVSLFDKAWQGLKDGFDKLLAPIKSAVEWLVDKVEWVLEKIDAAKDAIGGVADTVGGAAGGFADAVGGFFGGIADKVGGVFGFAEGGVFQPNSPQLAILGDNKTEPEVAAPYSMIVKAVGDALAGSRTAGTSREVVELVVKLDSKTIARSVYDPLENERIRRGAIQ